MVRGGIQTPNFH